MPYPTDLGEVGQDLRGVKTAFRQAGVPTRLINGIETRALRSGRRQTGEFQSNREARWQLEPADPQYGAEIDCKIILIRLLGMLLEFRNAPTVSAETKELIETKYLGRTASPGTYRDALLLEYLDFAEFLEEASQPSHGHSNFHIGHQDPHISPKHVPDNITWRTHRSNLIQGNMTLREARIYIIRLIGRYFELDEIDIT